MTEQVRNRLFMAFVALFPIPFIVWCFFLMRSMTENQTQIQSHTDKIARIYKLQQAVYGLEEVISDQFLAATDTSFDDWNRIYQKAWQASLGVDWTDASVFDMRNALPRIDNLYQRIHKRKFKRATIIPDSIRVENLTGEMIDEIHRAAESLGISAEKLRTRSIRYQESLSQDWHTAIKFLIIASAITILISVIAVFYRYSLQRNKKLALLLYRLNENVSGILGNTPDGVCTVDEHFKVLLINEPFKRLFHLRHQIELHPGSNMIDHLKPDAQAAWVIVLTRAMRGEKFMIEQQFQLPDRLVLAEVSFNPVLVNNKVNGTAIHIHEVTKQKRSQETADRKNKELQDTIERQFRMIETIVQTAHDGAMIVDAAGQFPFQNDVARDIMTTAGTPTSLSLWSGIHGVFLEGSEQPIDSQKLLERARSGEIFSILVRNERYTEGQKFEVSASSLTEGDDQSRIIAFKAPPEIIPVMQEVPVPEIALKGALEEIPQWAFTINREMAIQSVNTAFEKRFNKPRYTTIGYDIRQLIHPDDQPAFENRIQEALPEHPVHTAFRFLIDGQATHMETRIIGGALTILCVGYSIEDMLLAEAAEEMRSAPQPLFTFDCDAYGVITQIEGDRTLMLPSYRSEWQGQSMFKLFEQDLPMQEAFYRALDGQPIQRNATYGQQEVTIVYQPVFDGVGIIAGLKIQILDAAALLAFQEKIKTRLSEKASI